MDTSRDIFKHLTILSEAVVIMVNDERSLTKDLRMKIELVGDFLMETYQLKKRKEN